MKKISVEKDTSSIKELVKSFPPREKSQLRYFSQIDKKAAEKINQDVYPINERLFVDWVLGRNDGQFEKAEEVQIDAVVSAIASCDLAHLVISGLIDREQLNGSLGDWDFGAWLEKEAPVDTLIFVESWRDWKNRTLPEAMEL